MFTINRKVPLYLCVGALVIGSSIGTSARILQGGDKIALMQRLMSAAFPSLQRHEATVVVSMSTASDYRWDRPPVVFVDVFTSQAFQKSEPALRSQYLHGSFSFVEDELENVVFSGDAVNDARSAQLERLTRTAGALRTDGALLETLSTLGAQFGPDKQTEFIRHINMKGLGDALGTSVEIGTTFVSRLHPEPSTYTGPPRWQLKMASLPDQMASCFVLLFEPFGGALTDVIRIKGACTPFRDRRH